MLDQMFTAENFRRIFDIENRKGFDLASRFFPTLEDHTLAVRDKVKEIRQHRAFAQTMASEEFKEKLHSLKQELNALKMAKSTAVDDLLEEISLEITKSSFKIELSRKMGPGGKPVFCIDAEPKTYFAIKQLQHNIYRIYGVKQSSRHDIVCQIRDTLNNIFPFEVVRTDISTFYESINRRDLILKLDEDQLLSSTSKKYIKQVLDSYGKIAGTSNGIPRGVGISAYLAELHLRQVDSAIRSLPGNVLYCRFVDDIVAIFARPPAGTSLGSYKDRIIEILNKNALANNPSKTFDFKTDDPGQKVFDYLGYDFSLDSGKLSLSPSLKRISKYQARLDISFEAYWKKRATQPRLAHRELVGRIKFLTGNARLANSKSHACTGIYFNNSAATDTTRFSQLDTALKSHIDTLKSSRLQKRLRKLKFSTGFLERRYHNFSTKELQSIVRAWKHA
jgi:hypothetical protein